MFSISERAFLVAFINSPGKLLCGIKDEFVDSIKSAVFRLKRSGRIPKDYLPQYDVIQKKWKLRVKKILEKISVPQSSYAKSYIRLFKKSIGRKCRIKTQRMSELDKSLNKTFQKYM